MGARSFFSRLRGTLETLFRIGGTAGLQLEYDPAALFPAIRVRDANNTAYAHLRADASYATIAALPTAASMPEGYIAEVLSQRCFYIARPNDGLGVWLRLAQASLGTWYGVTDIYVSPEGTAENSGLDAAHPITADELQARGFGCNAYGENDTVVVVHILRGSGASYGNVVWNLPQSRGIGGIFFQGEQTLINASAFTAVTARNPPTNVPLQVTNANAHVWAQYDQIMLTGAHAGASMAIGKIAGNTATVGTALNIAWGIGVNGISLTTFSEVTPGATEAYAILQLPLFSSLHIDIPAGGHVPFGVAFNYAMILQDVTVTNNLTITNACSRGVATMRVSAGGWRVVDNGTSIVIIANAVTTSVTDGGGTDDFRFCGTNANSPMDLIGGVFGAEFFQFTSGQSYIDEGSLFVGQSAHIRIDGPSLCEISDAGFFDSAYAVNVRDGGQVRLEANDSGLFNGSVWGTSAVPGSVTFEIEGGGMVRKTSGQTWVVTSPHQGTLHATTDARIGGLNDCNSFDRASGTGAYVGLVTLTMAHLDAAVGAAGFGGHAWSPEFGAGFTT